MAAAVRTRSPRIDPETSTSSTTERRVRTRSRTRMSVSSGTGLAASSSSVRGAIDVTLVAGQLLALNCSSYQETVYDAMTVALSGRIYLDETVAVTPEQVLRQIWEDHFILNPAAAQPG